MEPVLDDYRTAAALLEVLEGLLGDYTFGLGKAIRHWRITIPVHGVYEEGWSLGEALAKTLLRLWDEKKLGVPKVF